MKYLLGTTLRNRMLKLPYVDDWQPFDSEQQLLERLLSADLTINAMAIDEAGRLFDPCNGEQDIDQGFLRHTGRQFADEPKNILAVALQAAELGCWGFRLAHGTHALMKRMVASGELDHLVPERAP